MEEARDKRTSGENISGTISGTGGDDQDVSGGGSVPISTSPGVLGPGGDAGPGVIAASTISGGTAAASGGTELGTDTGSSGAGDLAGMGSDTSVGKPGTGTGSPEARRSQDRGPGIPEA